MVDANGLVLAVATTAANCHDSKLLLVLLDKADINRESVSMPIRRIAARNIAML